MPQVIPLDRLQQFAAVNLLLDPGLVPGQKIVPQVATVTLKFSLDSGKIGHVVMAGRYAGAFSGSTAQANAIHTGLSTGGAWTALAAFFSTTTLFTGVDLRNIGIRDQPIISSTTTAQAGSSASPALPNEVALALTLRTANVGPRYRGRSYIPGWATNALGAGNVAAAAAVTALNNWQGTISGVFTTSGYTWCLALPERNAYVSAITGRSFPHRDPESPTITSATPNNHWDSQRRRGLR